MLGTVLTLRRYPVKSMLGEEVSSSPVTTAGLAGDRGLALVHLTTGRVVSAKNPRLWRAMLTLTATAEGAGDGEGADDSAPEHTVVKITFPDGTVALSTDADIDGLLSGFLGQPVTLTATPPADATMEHADPDQVIREGVTAAARTTLIRIGAGAPEGTFFNFAPVHLITTATLDRLAELNDGDGAGVGEPRYRPNVVIRTPDGAGFTENDWLGDELTIGGARLLVVARTPRCAVPTLAHGDHLPRDPAALRLVATHNRVLPFLTAKTPEPCAGVYANVLTPGQISIGDVITRRKSLTTPALTSKSVLAHNRGHV